MSSQTATSTEPMPYPLVAYSGNNLIDMFLDLLYKSDAAYFHGSGISFDGKVQYAYNVRETPAVNLGTTADATTGDLPAHNIALNFDALSMQIYQNNGGKQGKKLFDVARPVTAYGILGVTSGILGFMSLTIVVEGSSFGDQVLTQLVNDEIVPSFQKSIENIKLPQLQHIFSTKLGGGVGAAAVISESGSQPVLQVGAVVNGATGLGSADYPSQDFLSELNSSSRAETAMILGMISSDAVNFVLRTLIGPQSMPFDPTSTTAGFGGGIRGTLYFSTPQVSISNGQASVSSTVSTSLELGVEGFGDWTWEPVPVPDVSAHVDFILQTAGKSSYLHLTGVEKIHIDLGEWPKIFKPIQSTIEDLIDGVANQFDGVISLAVQGVYVPLFQLPDTIPGTNILAVLSFAPNGLGFYGHSVRALISALTV